VNWSEYPTGDPLRGTVRAAIEEASQEALSVSDALPDELIAAAQAEGISLEVLRLWIYTDKPEGWSAPAFVRWWRAIEAVKRQFRAMQEARP
jgi:hypothetical protein